MKSTNANNDRTNVLSNIFKKYRKRSEINGNNDAVYFSIEDVRQVLRDRENEQRKEETKVRVQNKQKLIEKALEENKNTVVVAAGIADILGFDPTKKINNSEKITISYKGVETKYRANYEKLIRLKTAIDNNAHSVDADLELAWSILKKESDKKKEVQDAIDRIYAKTYGICEITGEQISTDRLLAVPFARYSTDGQREYERQQALKKEKDSSVLFGNDTSDGFGSSYDDTEEE